MVKRNESIATLASSFLFQEIARRRRDFLHENPDAKVISLGIGDTTHPIPSCVVDGIKKKAEELGTTEGYTGYPEYNGDPKLRELIAKEFYKGRVDAEEIFISDGSKPDLARLQFLFPSNATYSVQDPVYPAFVDQTVISGRGGMRIGETNQYDRFSYLSCTPENDFFPDLEKAAKTDVMIFCSPNNPTGATASREQLERLVAFAKKSKTIIIFDASYADFICDESIPKSIFEIEGARDCALETNSFSKMAGFTGIRLGWTVCPKELKFEDGNSVWNDWSRIAATCFNGPPNLSEAAGIVCMTRDGREATLETVKYYQRNTKTLHSLLTKIPEFSIYGGVNSPYIWARSKKSSSSWDIFDTFLKEMNIVVTPGLGFGTEGEGYVRFSSFAKYEDVLTAAERIAKHYKLDSPSGKVIEEIVEDGKSPKRIRHA